MERPKTDFPMKKYCLILAALMLWGFFLRIHHLGSNYSFWVDEANSAAYARRIVNTGSPRLPTGYYEPRYFFPHYLMAASMLVFGQNEFAVRLPSVFGGVLSIFLVFLLAKKFFGAQTALIATFLTTFSLFEIVWSRQARGYIYLQNFFLVATYWLSLWGEIKIRKIVYLLGLFLIILVGFLIHPLALLFIPGAIFWLSLSLRINWQKRFGVAVSFIFLLLLFLIERPLVKEAYHHLRYYEYFFRRNYLLIYLFSFMGGVLGLIKERKKSHLILLFLFFYGLYILLYPQEHYLRYVLPVFPFWLIMASFGFVGLVGLLFKKEKLRLFLSFGLILFFVISNEKFSLFPMDFYSLNSDMREIPEPDFKSAYSFMKTNFGLKKDYLLIETRPDAARWYLGEGSVDYWLRSKESLAGYSGERQPTSGALFVSDLETLGKIVNENKKGVVVLEYSELPFIPREVVDFIENNLKLEYKTDHLVGNESSVWPLCVYSWGW